MKVIPLCSAAFVSRPQHSRKYITRRHLQPYIPTHLRLVKPRSPLWGRQARQWTQLWPYPKSCSPQARRLLGYPTELAQQAISAATAALADASRAIDDLLDVGGDLRRALEAVLDCPLLADSDLGKEVADILDTLDMGGDVTSQVRELSRQFSSGASEALDAALESPTAQLANMSKVYDEALQRGGINELVNKVRELRKCVDDLCRGYEIADRLPKSADAMLAEIGAKVDETSGEVMASLANAADETQQAGREALEEFRALAETVRSE